MKKYLLASLGAVLIAAILIFNFNSEAKSADTNVSGIVIASYNVENLFDMEPNGSEYPEYIPNFKGWDELAHKTKLANTAKVIKDIGADVVALQEIENENALKELLGELKKDGVEYPYHAITTNAKTAVQNAVISKFKIKSSDELSLKRQYKDRPILKVSLQIGDDELILYANHWKAKTGAESKRIEYAKLLKEDIDRLPKDVDFVIAGDLNSNYNEMESFLNNKKLNDTNGLTGINHILKTAKSAPNSKPQLASKADVIANQNGEYLYNLWLEIPKRERVSEWFAKELNTPDNIILPRSMFDKKGVSYEDGSFEVFRPPYLLKNGRAFRWEMGGKSKKFSVPQGYSDHLPVFAKFYLGGFKSKDESVAKIDVQKTKESSKSPIKTVQITDLYDMDGIVDVLVKGCAVIYKHYNSVILKQKNGRAIFVYNAPDGIEEGGVYDIRVGKLEDYHGLKEIKNIIDYKKVSAIKPSDFWLGGDAELLDSKLQNEVVSNISGLFSKGKLLYGDSKEIRIYFKDKALRPKNLTKINIKTGHIGFYNEPQIVIYRPGDFEVIEQ